MDDDARSLERCTACNHLTSLHGEGCFALAFPKVGMDLDRCPCVRTPATMNSYTGAPTFEEIKVSVPVEQYDDSEGYFDGNGYWHLNDE